MSHLTKLTILLAACAGLVSPLNVGAQGAYNTESNWPAPRVQSIPSGLAPGMYYYFRDGEEKPTIHYVPGSAGAAAGDPFSKPVKPLPVPGQENFPTIPFSDLQDSTLADFEPLMRQREQNRTPVNPGQWSPPVYQPPPGVAQQRQENLLDAVEKGQTPQMFQQPQAPPVYQPYQQPAYQAPQSSPYQQPPYQAPQGSPYQQPAYQAPRASPYLQPPYQAPPQTGLVPMRSNGAQLSAPLRQPGMQQRPAPVQPAMQPTSISPSANPFQQSGVTSAAISPASPIRGMQLDAMEQAAELAMKAGKLLQLKKYKDAVPLLEKAAAFDPNPNSAKIHANLGTTYSQLGTFDQALKQYNIALQFDPHLYTCYNGIAAVYQGMGKVPEAKMWFQKYLQVSPTAHDADEIRGFIAAMDKAQGKMPSDDPNGLDYYQSVVPGEPLTWAAERMPIKVFIGTGDGVAGYRKPFRGFVSEAFNVWADASGHKLTWTPVSERNGADVTVDWFSSAARLSQSTGAEGGTCQPTSTVLPDGRQVLKKAEVCFVTIHPDAKEATDPEMRKVCLHEIGHCLGLYGHSSNNNDIMFFSESPTVATAPTSRDRATITRLYADHPVAGH